MTRFARLFAELDNKRPAQIPFLMLGDPSPQLSLPIIRSVIDAGIDALELGFPFSDPIADGPIIQAAASRARQQSTTMSDCFAIIQTIRQQYSQLPIGILIYANLVFQYGIDPFYKKAQEIGIDAVLIPDVPTLESAPFVKAAKQNQIDPIFMVTPTCTDDCLQQAAIIGQGYLYIVTRKGVTGIDQRSEFTQAAQIVHRLSALNAPPAVFGFGLKGIKDIQQAADAGAKGVIIGSALIDQIQKLITDQPINLQKINEMAMQLFDRRRTNVQ